jgi:hypothetical protein
MHPLASDAHFAHTIADPTHVAAIAFEQAIRVPARTRGGFEFGEAAKLRAENASLRARIKMLAPTVPGELVKLRSERAGLTQALKQAVRERDAAQRIVDRVTSPAWRKLRMAGRLNVEVFNVIAKALHGDRLEMCSTAELNEAAGYFLELRPLFERPSR